MNRKAVYERGPNLIIRKNLYRLKFVHTCVVCGINFRVVGPDGIEIPTTQEERNELEDKIDNIYYTDSHGICDKCNKKIKNE